MEHPEKNLAIVFFTQPIYVVNLRSRTIDVQYLCLTKFDVHGPKKQFDVPDYFRLTKVGLTNLFSLPRKAPRVSQTFISVYDAG